MDGRNVQTSAENVLGGDEKVVRALCLPQWDPVAGRATPSAFEGNDISVSRTAVLPLDRIIDIFREELEHDGRLVVATGTTLVRDISEACATHESKKSIVRVVADPVAPPRSRVPNSSHAEIRSY